MNVAIIKTGALGDVVRTTSLLPAIATRFPVANITWITSRAALPLIGYSGIARAVTIDDPADAPWRSARYEWTISLDDDFESCRLATCLRGERRSGAYIDGAGGRAYTTDLAAWFGMGILRPRACGGLDAANALKRANGRTYGELLFEGLGLPLPVARPSVPLTLHAARNVAAWLATRGIAGSAIVGMNTGAGGRWRHKSWGIEASALAARLLAAFGSTVLILGGLAEAQRNAAICAQAAHPRVVAGPTEFDVLSFAALVARCSSLICSDSLALQLAVAFGRPVVALFGPTSDAEIDVFGLGEKIVAPVPCRRCYLSTCEVHPNCMEMLTPDIVIARWRHIVKQAFRVRSGLSP